MTGTGSRTCTPWIPPDPPAPRCTCWTARAGSTRTLLAAPTPLGPTDAAGWVFAVADHDGDGHQDLYAIDRRLGAGTASVHILDGADGFASWLEHAETALPVLPVLPVGGPDGSAFAVGDQDRDGRPDVLSVRYHGRPAEWRWMWRAGPKRLSGDHGRRRYPAGRRGPGGVVVPRRGRRRRRVGSARRGLPRRRHRRAACAERRDGPVGRPPRHRRAGCSRRPLVPRRRLTCGQGALAWSSRRHPHQQVCESAVKTSPVARDQQDSKKAPSGP